MSLENYLIKNLRTSDQYPDNRLITFTAVNSESLLDPPQDQFALASSTGLFKVCLSPLVIPSECELASNSISLRISDISEGMTWSLINKNTEEEIISGVCTQSYQNSNIEEICESISNISYLNAYRIQTDGNPLTIQNNSDEDLSLLLRVSSPSEEYGYEIIEYVNEYEGAYENLSYKSISSEEVSFCLIKALCSVQSVDLLLKKPDVDLTNNRIKISYTVDNNNYPSGVQEQTLLSEYVFENSDRIQYDINYVESVYKQMYSVFSSFAVITNNTPKEEYIAPFNACIDNIGDVEFVLRLKGSNFSEGANFIWTEDSGKTFQKVSSSLTDITSIIIDLGNKLIPYGFTYTSVSYGKINVKKTATKSFIGITNGYEVDTSSLFSYSINNSDWGYDGSYSVDGNSRDAIAVRPTTCTLGVKDPARQLNEAVLTFKGLPVSGDNLINYGRITMVKSEHLDENELDFLETFTNLDSFSFETCSVKIKMLE